MLASTLGSLRTLMLESSQINRWRVSGVYTVYIDAVMPYIAQRAKE